MSENKYGHRPLNWFVSVVDKLGGEEGADAFLRDELEVRKPEHDWEERGGLIYFDLVSNGWTGLQWIEWYDQHGYPLSPEARFILNSADFQPIPAGTRLRIAVIPGKLFSDDDRVTRNIRAKADELKLIHGKDLPPEVVCLVRQKFSNKEIRKMGLTWIIGLHETIRASDGDPDLLSVSARVAKPWLHADWDRPGHRWDSDYGFACLVPPARNA